MSNPDPPSPHEAGAGPWRDGKLLVMDREGTLPDRCVKTNRPTEGRVICRLYWVHPVVKQALLVVVLFLAVPAGVLLSLDLSETTLLMVLGAVVGGGFLPWFAVLLITRRGFKVTLPLSWSWYFRQRYLGRLGMAIVIACSIATVFMIPEYGIRFNKAPNSYVLITLHVGVALRIISKLWIKVTRITSRHAWLAGIHPEYVESLPPWPGL